MSNHSLITLTTDFGTASPYVAVMKGVILSINPAARILDLTHDIRPQDLRHASYYLSTATPYFPAGTIHLCVVDPGVGSDRAPICVDASEQRFVGPDNGIFSGIYCKAGGAVRVRRLTERRFWRPKVSDTFHGRDIFAPVAAHLSLGIDFAEVGPEQANPVQFQKCSAVTFGRRWQGEVQFIDDFGNLITNIPACKLKSLPMRVSVGSQPSQLLRWVRTYSDAAPGEIVCLFSSDGYFEVAAVNGNAAKKLGVTSGTMVELDWE